MQKLTEQHRHKISIAMKGRKLSEEHKTKLEPYSSYPFITAKDFLEGKKVEEPINLDGKIFECEGSKYIIKLINP